MDRSGTAIVVMGVSGSGKSSIADLLARRLGYRFIEGDRLHPQHNIDKMEQGVPLTDEDRWPWLDLIGSQLATAREQGLSTVVTCSALKRTYRDRLRGAVGAGLCFLYLKGDEALLVQRMQARTGHFMPVSLLHSQLATLESPEGEPDVVTVGINAPVASIVDDALSKLGGCT